jgi:phosphomannomutase
MPATAEQKQALKSSDSAKNLLLEYSKKLEPQNGRLLVRPSGTEPLIRITMWGDNESAIATLANQLKNELENTLAE